MQPRGEAYTFLGLASKTVFGEVPMCQKSSGFREAAICIDSCLISGRDSEVLFFDSFPNDSSNTSFFQAESS